MNVDINQILLHKQITLSGKLIFENFFYKNKKNQTHFGKRKINFFI